MTRGDVKQGFFLSILLLTGMAGRAAAHDDKVHLPPASGRQVIWENPGRVSSRDLEFGPGGRAGVPAAPFTFLQEDSSGTTPKVNVRDAQGRTWNVKWGEEVHSEIFASRLAWSVGYIVESEYYVPQGLILGVDHHSLKRAAKEIDRNGVFHSARFQLRSQPDKFSKEYDWTWKDNPFVGTAELNGLRIMMLLTSNWDNKDARDIGGADTNTAIFVRNLGRTVEYRYFVQDWGATMGRWGGAIKRSKWDCIGYDEESKHFIKGVKDGLVEWGYSGKHTGSAKDDIPVQHVWWLMRYLGQLTDRQLLAALRASGATEGEERCYLQAVRARIDVLASFVPRR